MPIPEKTYTTVIADDHEIIRGVLLDFIDQAVFDDGYTLQLSDVAENGIEALAAAKSCKPDLMFLDISMPLVSGADIIHDVRRWSPHTKIIVFTGITASGLLASIVETGIDGLFSKGSSVSNMFEQIPLILRGARIIAPEFVSILQQGQQSVSLTNRERQVLSGIISGKTNKEVGIKLSISPKTVDKHRTSLMAKLDVHSISQLMAKALKDGLVESL